MNVYYATRTYNSYGGDITHGHVGGLIERAIDGAAYGISELSIFANYATALPARPTLEESHQQFHQRLARLPEVKYQRKKQRLSIEFKSNLGLAENILGVWHDPLTNGDDAMARMFPRPSEPDPKLFRAAFAELVDVLGGIVSVLARKPGLKLDQFVAKLSTLSLPDSDDEILRLCRQYDAEDRARFATMPWWQKIEWDDYHPNARVLLDDPIFWDPTDDTWFDVLADFRRWRRRNRDAAPLKFLDRLFQQWGVPEGRSASHSGRKLPAPGDDDLAASMRDEARVALAFAQIKVEGVWDEDVRQSAIAALDRQIANDADGQGPLSREGMGDALAKFRAKLIQTR